MKPQQPSCCLGVERRDDAVVARFTRELVLSGPVAEAAAERLTALLTESGGRPLLVDFGNVLSLSSLMLGKLAELSRAADSAGVWLALFNLRPNVRGVLEITRLNLLLRLYGDEPEALQAAERRPGEPAVGTPGLTGTAANRGPHRWFRTTDCPRGGRGG
jgi:anti-anti-sigma factor